MRVCYFNFPSFNEQNLSVPLWEQNKRLNEIIPSEISNNINNGINGTKLNETNNTKSERMTETTTGAFYNSLGGRVDFNALCDAARRALMKV